MEVVCDLPASDLAVDVVACHLGHPDRAVRFKIIETLTRIGTEHAAASMLPLLDDSRREVRFAAVTSLGRIKARAAAPALLALLQAPGDDVEMQQAACEALGAIGDESAVPVLLETVRAGHWLGRLHASARELRLAAALALGSFSRRDRTYRSCSLRATYGQSSRRRRFGSAFAE